MVAEGRPEDKQICGLSQPNDERGNKTSARERRHKHMCPTKLLMMTSNPQCILFSSFQRMLPGRAINACCTRHLVAATIPVTIATIIMGGCKLKPCYRLPLGQTLRVCVSAFANIAIISPIKKVIGGG